MGDAPIFAHIPKIFVVIRLGLCGNCVKVRYINRLTVFHGIDVGKHWRTTANESAKLNRLNYIIYGSYASVDIVVFISHTNREGVMVKHLAGLVYTELLTKYGIFALQ